MKRNTNLVIGSLLSTVIAGCSHKPNTVSNETIYFSHSAINIASTVEAKQVAKIELPIIYFANDSAEVTPTERTKLKHFLDSLGEKRPSIILNGHTDWNRSEQYNDQLGLKRSESVLIALVDVGYPAEKLATASLGESHPVADNQTARGRQLNRRVTLSLF
jgi:OOP family OmpA-OmpF porin